MPTITIELPDELISVSRQSPADFARELRLAAAIHWYARGKISQEQAAAVAGLTRAAFLEALAQQHVDVFQVDVAELKREMERA